MTDAIRPRGTVIVTCTKCGWSFWVDALDPRLPGGPFVCPESSPCPDESTPRAEDP